MPSGYATKPSPGPFNRKKKHQVFIQKVQATFNRWKRRRKKAILPEDITFSTGTFCACAIKPNMQNITNPAKKLVAQLINEMIIASLGRREGEHYQSVVFVQSS